MANERHLNLLKQGKIVWNQWRDENPQIEPDLSYADLCENNLRGTNLINVNLSKAKLNSADLRGVYLHNANLSGAYLNEADLSRAILKLANLSNAMICGANLRHANLIKANLIGANLNRANLSKAYLNSANLSGANLVGTNFHAAKLKKAIMRRANLTVANLSEAQMQQVDLNQAILTRAIIVQTNLEAANITNCRVYGVAVWNPNLRDAKQSDLIITRYSEATISVDSMEVAQFIYLLLNNEKIRDVIDTVTSKVVLILGRFTPKRKAVLDTIRNELRLYNYVPILFDFRKPSSRDFTETISTLAHLSRFIIVDISAPMSVPQELQAIIPTLQVPVQPLINNSTKGYGMFIDLRKYPWVLKTYCYNNDIELLTSLKEKVIDPAEATIKQLRKN